MRLRTLTTGLICARSLWAMSGRPAAHAASISEGDAALERGATSAVSLLGRSGGFLDNPKVRIPLPEFLNEAAKLAKFTGQQ